MVLNGCMFTGCAVALSGKGVNHNTRDYTDDLLNGITLEHIVNLLLWYIKINHSLFQMYLSKECN